MPRGTEKLPISNMNMAGMGPKMIKGIMKKKNVDSLQTLMKTAMDMGVKVTACAMSMDIMGIHKEGLIDGIEIAGVATYLGVYIATVLQNPYNSEFLNLDLFQLLNIPTIALFYFVLFKTTRISAIASLSTVALTAGLLIFANNEFFNILVLVFVFILILVKHSENIKRLIEGKENKF